MSDLYVNREKRTELAERMARLGVSESDVVEKFVLGSGKGGQKRNKTSSCVYIRHLPSGIEVKCQESRSREVNRHLARRILCEKLEEKVLGIMSAAREQAEKIRRQKRRRSRRQKERMLADKRVHSVKKRMRGPVNGGTLV